MLRRASAIGFVALIATGLTACASEPEPEWTEEEAYAAAEETFRAFISAAYSADATTLTYVTGQMEGLEREAEDKADSAGLEIRGEVEVVNFESIDFDKVGDAVSVKATACVDSTSIEIRLDDADWDQPRDEPVYGVVVSLMSVGDELLINEFEDSEGVDC